MLNAKIYVKYNTYSSNSFSILFLFFISWWIQSKIILLKLLKLIKRTPIYINFKFIISPWRKAIKKPCSSHRITASKGSEMSRRTIIIIVCLTLLAIDLAASEICGNTQNQVQFLNYLFKNTELKWVFCRRFLKSYFPLFLRVGIYTWL